jgi:3-oxoacyl-[acyl-carrier protein] reductase
MSTDTLLLCGASSDIGLALLGRLSSNPQGPLVIAHCYRGAERVGALASRFGERLLSLEADLSSEDGCSQLVERVRSHGWSPTQFVHLSALPMKYARFEQFDWARFLGDLEVQVGALVRLLPHWLPRPRRGGSLRNVVVVSSSVTLGVPPKYMSMYTAVKYAQLGLIRSLAAEGAERGVVANLVSPSMVETRFLDEIPRTARELAAAASPLGRNASADEVADVLHFLLTDRPLLNGANIPLAGGSAF